MSRSGAYVNPQAATGRARGPDIDIADVSPEKVNTFLIGDGPLTTTWYVKHNALRGFYRYAISRGFVATSPLPLTIPKLPPFKPYIYSPAELRRILDSTESCRRPRSDLDASVMRALILLMYAAALRTSEALSLRVPYGVGIETGRISTRNFRCWPPTWGINTFPELSAICI
jgi:integrase/recombinase XerD